MIKKSKITKNYFQTTKPKIIFFGNGPLAEYTLSVLSSRAEIIFVATSSKDLKTACNFKQQYPEATAILASFGKLIPESILEQFEPEGIINIHPSLLPEYRGPSPIETAILDGKTDFGVSVMKLSQKMDAGPIYFQTQITFPEDIPKNTIYEILAKTGAKWILDNLNQLVPPKPQNESKATYTKKMNTSMAKLEPEKFPAQTLHNHVRAFLGFPKSRYTWYQKDCIVLETAVKDQPETVLDLKCQDGKFLVIKLLQPAGKKPMSPKAFLNGIQHK